MKNQTVTTGIILGRTDFGEADRIITVLTPDHGKLRLMAKGVRRVKSKLAGGIELFSTSNITFIEGRGDIGTLISSRLIKHYGKIVSDITRVQLGYDLLKQLNKNTADHPEDEYYHLLENAFAALDDTAISTDLINAWFRAQLLRLAGHTPNLATDTNGDNLDAQSIYNFDSEAMTFSPHSKGRFNANHIKTLRLLFSQHQPTELAKVQGMEVTLKTLNPLILAMTQQHL